jgi:uncharacterized OB-fold protein
MIHDQHLEPPDDCEACDEYYVYKDGLCWRCWQEAKEDREIAREERRILTRMEEES